MSADGLKEQLERLATGRRYPFHMPGHKRLMEGMDNPYRYDITEIADFDDLRDPQGVIGEMLSRIRGLYDAKEAYLSVNGSTCSNLAMIFAATKQHDTVLVADNCHRSVWHAAELRELSVHRLTPAYDAAGIAQGFCREEIAAAFTKHPDIRCVILTSPTYEGMVSDIAAIAAFLHAHDITLLVDAAHGAHFTPAHKALLREANEGICRFPVDALKSGADAVTESLHKTLPMPGQTGVLLLPEKSRVDGERLHRYLHMFQTSSPSYLLMAMVDNGLQWLETNGAAAFSMYARRLQAFYDATAGLSHLSIVPPGHRDPGKIVITLRDGKNAVTGEEIAERLREKYLIDVELAAERYIIAMTSLMDTAEGFERLRDAIFEMDEKWQ